MEIHKDFYESLPDSSKKYAKEVTEKFLKLAKKMESLNDNQILELMKDKKAQETIMITRLRYDVLKEDMTIRHMMHHFSNMESEGISNFLDD